MSKLIIPEAPFPQDKTVEWFDRYRSDVFEDTGGIYGTPGLWYVDDGRQGTQRRPVNPARCYNFDGVDDYVEFLSNPNIVQFSVRTILMKFELTGTGWYRPFWFGPTGGLGTGSGFLMEINRTSNSFNIGVRGDQSSVLLFTNVPYTWVSGNFYEVILEIRSDGFDFYINNQLEAGGLFDVQNTSYSIVGDNKVAQNPRSFKAKVYDFEFWNEILSQPDKDLWANNPISFIESKRKQYGANLKDYLKLHLKCDESKGNKAIDSSGNFNNGTIVNHTETTFFATDTSGKIPSHQNQVGYLKADGVSHYYDQAHTQLIPEGNLIPRDESNPKFACAFDSSGNQVKLTYNLPARKPMQIKGQNVGNFTSTTHYLQFSSNTNWATLEYEGNAVLALDIPNSRVTCSTIGKFWDIRIKDGSGNIVDRLPVSKGEGTIAHNITRSNNATFVNATNPWSTSEFARPVNLIEGFTLDGSARVPAKSRTLDADGNPLGTKGFSQTRGLNNSEINLLPNPFNAPELIKAKNWNNTTELGYADVVESNPLFVDTSKADRKSKLLVYKDSITDPSSKLDIIKNYNKIS